MLRTIDELLPTFIRGLTPDPTLTFTDWARKHYMLPPGSATKGLIQLDRTPYMIDILDNLSWTEATIKEERILKGTQLGLTTVGQIVVEGTIDVFPCPVLMLFGSDDMAVEHVKLRVEPSIENNPRLRNKVRDSLDKRGKSTKRLKLFPGGSLKSAGGVSGKGFRHYTAGIVIIDDADTLKEDIGGTKKSAGEGHPFKLAKNRTDARNGRYKMLIQGTPTEENVSLIYPAFLETNQMEYFVNCPFCGHSQVIDFFQIKFEHKNWELKSDPELECINPECKSRISERYKYQMMQPENGAIWKSLTKGTDKAIVGRRLPSTYSLLGYTWNDMAKDWLSACREEENGKLTSLITFFNTRLAKVWLTKKNRIELKHSDLYESREEYTKVPKDAAVIVCGIDVQDNRIEITVAAFTESQHRYYLEHKIIGGDPWIDIDEGGPWIDLAQFLLKEYENDWGFKQPILQSAIDMGYCTENVGKFVIKAQNNGIDIEGIFGGHATRGRKKTFLSEPTVNKYGVPVREINVSEGKFITYNQLNTEDTAKRLIHFNKHPSFSENFFKQLTVEKPNVSKNQRGQTVITWECPDHARNEATDSVNYSLAAFEIFSEHGVNWEEFIEWNSKGCKHVQIHENSIISEGISA